MEKRGLTILQAYELAKAGKTVISPLGLKVTAVEFERFTDWTREAVFGEWRVRRGPRVCWANDYGTGGLFFHPTKDACDQNDSPGRIACVKFIEVMDEVYR